METLYNSLAQCLAAAGLQATYNVQSALSDSIPQKHSSLTSMETLLNVITAPLRTCMTIHLPDAGHYNLTVKTHLSSPYHGTLLEVETSTTNHNALEHGRPHFLQFHDAAEVRQHTISFVCSAVARHVVQLERSWTLQESGVNLRRVDAPNQQIRSITVTYQKERLALFGGQEGEQPGVVAVWQGTSGQNKQRSLAEVLDTLME